MFTLQIAGFRVDAQKCHYQELEQSLRGTSRGTEVRAEAYG